MIPGRAHTREQKVEVIDRILAAWEKCPQERLGQLIVNSGIALNELYGVEDFPLAQVIEASVAKGAP